MLKEYGCVLQTKISDLTYISDQVGVTGTRLVFMYETLKNPNKMCETTVSRHQTSRNKGQWCPTDRKKMK